ncbi:MAG: hypothetical protein ACP5OO_03675 [Chloroflexia bacterium]
MKGPRYPVTIELSELELALLYHAATRQEGTYRLVFWKEEDERRSEQHYVGPNWLERKVFGCIAEHHPEWLPVIEEARRKLAFQKG